MRRGAVRLAVASRGSHLLRKMGLFDAAITPIPKSPARVLVGRLRELLIGPQPRWAPYIERNESELVDFEVGSFIKTKVSRRVSYGLIAIVLAILLAATFLQLLM